MCPSSGPVAPGTECLWLIDLQLRCCLRLCPLLIGSIGGNSTSSSSTLAIGFAEGLAVPVPVVPKGKEELT
jgi:hypothetical protein